MLALVLVACGDASRTDIEPQQLSGNRVAGVLFDPATIQVGARVGAMSLDSIEVRAAFDSTRVGTARFSGLVEVRGAKLRHFDSDVDALCFEADSASAARLPRWAGDERRSWFCFANRAAAQSALGPPGPPGDSTTATIVIDRLTIHRGLSDEVNSARFVRAVTR